MTPYIADNGTETPFQPDRVALDARSVLPDAAGDIPPHLAHLRASYRATNWRSDTLAGLK